MRLRKGLGIKYHESPPMRALWLDGEPLSQPKNHEIS